MKTNLLVASLAALLMAAPMAMAQGVPIIVAEEAAAIPAEVASYLGDQRAPQDLALAELVERVRTGGRLIQIQGLSKAVRQQVAQARKQAADELRGRKAAAAPKAKPAEPAPVQTQVEAAPLRKVKPAEPAPPKAKPAERAPPKVAAVPEEVTAFLADDRPAQTLSQGELISRLQLAKRLMALDGVPQKTRRAVAERRREAAGEFQARKQSATAPARKVEPAPARKVEPAPAAPVARDAPAAPAADGTAADAVLADRSPLAGLSDADLRAKLIAARDLVRSKGLPAARQKLLVARFRELRSETLRRKAAGGVKPATPPIVADTPPDKPLDAATGTPDAEAKARAFLNAGKAESLKDAELGARLRGMRELLKENAVSRPTKLAMLARLKEDREVFRARVAQRKLDRDKPAAGGTTTNSNNTTTTNTTVINNITNIKIVLRDRRPADRLADAELRRRIQLYRDANDRRLESWDDPDFADGDRVYWREQMVRDRIALRNRLIAARERRASSLRVGVSDGGFNFDLDLDFTRRPSRPPPPPSIFVAEADDEEIETQLIAPPARKPQRRYTVKEIEDDPEIRAAMPAIEIDTIKFGFGEANVREEEVESLDHIAEVIEKILAKSPGEVFLIEGHTDAVGSDASNLDLSRRRAAAVIESLTTYFVIPERNLKPVGYGERQLKIPTAEAEQENRRVSIRRVTPLVGSLDE